MREKRPKNVDIHCSQKSTPFNFFLEVLYLNLNIALKILEIDTKLKIISSLISGVMGILAPI